MAAIMSAEVINCRLERSATRADMQLRPRRCIVRPRGTERKYLPMPRQYTPRSICRIEGCESVMHARQLCGNHYLRLLQGLPMKPVARQWPRLSEEMRFRTHIQERDGCWVWTGYLNACGYGVFHVGYRSDETGVRTMLAHRWAYEHFISPVPAGLELDHVVCGNRACVNPAHLEAVSHHENVLRGRLVKTHCLRGHELTDGNLYMTKTGRRCRACHLADSRERRMRGQADAG